MSESKELTPIGQICTTLDTMGKKFQEALDGTGINPSRFIATAKTAIQTHADTDKLARANRQSLYLAIQRSAGDGLMPDGREAALVVYGDKVQYQPMVQGLVKLARNSGEIESLGAFIVHEKDSFTYRAGIDNIPIHDCPNWFADRGAPIGVWAFVKLKTGDYLSPVMLTKERIDRIATRSKMAGNYNPQSGKDWEEFWKKAAIRNILKYAPKSTALEKAMQASDDEFDMNKESVYLEQPKEAIVPVKKETKAAAVVKAAAKVEPEPEPIHDPQTGEIHDAYYEELPL